MSHIISQEDFAIFRNFVNGFVAVGEDVLEKIAVQLSYGQIKKGKHLFKTGEVCEDFIFITKGYLRYYFAIGEKETSVWFSLPYSLGIEVGSFISGKPGKFSVQAITDVKYLQLPKIRFEQIRAEFPHFNAFYIRLCEQTILTLIDRLVSFQYLTAEQRYQELLKHPGYMMHIPHKYLASYLGITPTSLSRLRHKITLA